jgi:hypothetical protein
MAAFDGREPYAGLRLHHRQEVAEAAHRHRARRGGEALVVRLDVHRQVGHVGAYARLRGELGVEARARRHQAAGELAGDEIAAAHLMRQRVHLHAAHEGQLARVLQQRLRHRGAEREVAGRLHAGAARRRHHLRDAGVFRRRQVVRRLDAGGRAPRDDLELRVVLRPGVERQQLVPPAREVDDEQVLRVTHRLGEGLLTERRLLQQQAAARDTEDFEEGAPGQGGLHGVSSLSLSTGGTRGPSAGRRTPRATPLERARPSASPCPQRLSLRRRTTCAAAPGWPRRPPAP